MSDYEKLITDWDAACEAAGATTQAMSAGQVLRDALAEVAANAREFATNLLAYGQHYDDCPRYEGNFACDCGFSKAFTAAARVNDASPGPRRVAVKTEEDT